MKPNLPIFLDFHRTVLQQQVTGIPVRTSSIAAKPVNVPCSAKANKNNRKENEKKRRRSSQRLNNTHVRYKEDKLDNGDVDMGSPPGKKQFSSAKPWSDVDTLRLILYTKIFNEKPCLLSKERSPAKWLTINEALERDYGMGRSPLGLKNRFLKLKACPIWATVLELPCYVILEKLSGLDGLTGKEGPLKLISRKTTAQSAFEPPSIPLKRHGGQPVMVVQVTPQPLPYYPFFNPHSDSYKIAKNPLSNKNVKSAFAPPLAALTTQRQTIVPVKMTKAEPQPSCTISARPVVFSEGTTKNPALSNKGTIDDVKAKVTFSQSPPKLVTPTLETSFVVNPSTDDYDDKVYLNEEVLPWELHNDLPPSDDGNLFLSTLDGDNDIVKVDKDTNHCCEDTVVEQSTPGGNNCHTATYIPPSTPVSQTVFLCNDLFGPVHILVSGNKKS